MTKFDELDRNTAFSLEQLIQLSQQQLDALYAQNAPKEIPHGISNGRAMFFPGTILNAPMAQLARMFWQGKVFDKENGVLLNRVLGMQIIKAKLSIGESWFDHKESIIIDYKDNSICFGWIRDEIRPIGQNLYLGRAYARTESKQCLVTNFALQIKD